MDSTEAMPECFVKIFGSQFIDNYNKVAKTLSEGEFPNPILVAITTIVSIDIQFQDFKETQDQEALQ